MAHVTRGAIMQPVRIESAPVQQRRYKMLRLGKSHRRIRSVKYARSASEIAHGLVA